MLIKASVALNGGDGGGILLCGNYGIRSGMWRSQSASLVQI